MWNWVSSTRRVGPRPHSPGPIPSLVSPCHACIHPRERTDGGQTHVRLVSRVRVWIQVLLGFNRIANLDGAALLRVSPGLTELHVQVPWKARMLLGRP